ncbi:ABC transporter ATP-binding protein [Pseudomonas veronii]|jgi:NitT/TauT family transport system ATP-binding protein|uniref:ABC transporter ATP-binding protein n=1 Tax=Pseudomonas TaxID=286 RepID=UPI000D367B84|nr:MULTISPECIES: ABC transporter ATP-binding protein [Pseudomonas]PUB29287.1 NitT/TauT family transport system ATP-binding protein [Pseudomonas sp. GV105]RTY77624.1 ABC transporter ATP-binding protein [Pseudomonas veronii]RWA27196.1 ABC transporter ATP-binding protein [Pseudomonas veronii]WKC46502.1 ABC transporter ATP-binding protein [Pseudomonas veronii]
MPVALKAITTPAGAERDERASALIQFIGVSKSFTVKGVAKQASHSINLSIEKGEVVTVVGPSGCGKSTLLNMVAGLFAPTEGQVVYNGKAVCGVNGRTGYMTQSDHLLPWRDVVGNIAVPLEIQGMPKVQRRERIQELIKLVGLEGFEKSYPSQLSGGMRKRAALARLLAYDPETLLMDEPFAALDAQLRMRMQTELIRLSRRLNKTVIFVTHDLDEAVALGDRCLIFAGRPGTIVKDVPIPLGEERNILQLRKDPRYHQLCGDLWDFMTPSLNDAAEGNRA